MQEEASPGLCEGLHEARRKKDKIKPKTVWYTRPQKHDYPAAQEFLTLMFSKKSAKSLADSLKKKDLSQFYAKDILRASGLTALGEENRHVAKNIEKMKAGVALSPILLVRWNGKIVIADGYHRLCAVYLFNEDIRIPCQITTKRK